MEPLNPDYNNPSTPMFGMMDGTYVEEIRAKYAEERLQRLRPDGNDQYTDLDLDLDFDFDFDFDHGHDHAEDNPNQGFDEPSPCEEYQYEHDPLIDIEHQRVVVIGAGLGGLLHAVRLLQTGDFVPRDILLVDAASGFGGTWNWNTYPGLMCDIESYIYLPLLEETGYMPSHKYVPGAEIKDHAYRIASMYSLYHRALFCTSVTGLVWDDDDEMQWTVRAVQYRRRGVFPLDFSADFVIMAAGLVSIPKMPNIDGVADYQGAKFHTARWDWRVTGGSTDRPVLDKLRDKRVAIIGTGATAVQVIPHLAEWSQTLYVFQRTPSAVDERKNRRTDPHWWETEVISQGPGWQRQRMENFNAFVTNARDLPAVNLVDDEWSHARSYSALVGGPQNLDTNSYLSEMEWVDLLRQDRIRERVARIVHNREKAELLKPWYSGWCKRPCFHDEYLQAFNKHNVTLVDTGGKGVACVSPKGVISNQTEYEVDVIVFATGFNVTGRGSPDAHADLVVSGRRHKSMRAAWKDGPATLHGLITHDFPNLFFPGPQQAGISPNYTYLLDQMARHVSYVISNAARKQNQGRYKVTVEPTVEAQEAWAQAVIARAGGLAGIANCTPGFLNQEGEVDKPKSMEETIQAARWAHWGEGVASWVRALEAWRAKGDMEGLEVLRLTKATVDLA